MTAVAPLFRSEVHRSKLGVAIAVTAGPLKTSLSCRVAPEFITSVRARANASNSSAPPRATRATFCVFRTRGLGFEEPKCDTSGEGRVEL